MQKFASIVDPKGGRKTITTKAYKQDRRNRRRTTKASRRANRGA